MGRPTEGKIRPICVTLTTYGKKISILKNKSKLGNTKIYLKEDFPPQVLEVRKSLQEQLQKERCEGKLAYLKYDKIVVRGLAKRGANSTQNQNSKKRVLEVTPPHPEGNSSSSNSEYLTKQGTSKKNKITRGRQGSLVNFVQRRDNSLQHPSTASEDDFNQ